MTAAFGNPSSSSSRASTSARAAVRRLLAEGELPLAAVIAVDESLALHPDWRVAWLWTDELVHVWSMSRDDRGSLLELLGVLGRLVPRDVWLVNATVWPSEAQQHGVACRLTLRRMPFRQGECT